MESAHSSLVTFSSEPEEKGEGRYGAPLLLTDEAGEGGVQSSCEPPPPRLSRDSTAVEVRLSRS